VRAAMSGATLRVPPDFGRLPQWVAHNAAGAAVPADAAVASAAVVTIAAAHTVISFLIASAISRMVNPAG
jgi:hypothetical protein